MVLENLDQDQKINLPRVSTTVGLNLTLALRSCEQTFWRKLTALQRWTFKKKLRERKMLAGLQFRDFSMYFCGGFDLNFFRLVFILAFFRVVFITNFFQAGFHCPKFQAGFQFQLFQAGFHFQFFFGLVSFLFNVQLFQAGFQYQLF